MNDTNAILKALNSATFELKSHFDELKEALRDATTECEEHNSEYHHTTPDYKIAYWKELTKEIIK